MSWTCRILTRAEFSAAEDRRMNLARTRTDGVQGASIREVVPPCSMWEMPWIHDPADPDDAAAREQAIAAIAAGTHQRMWMSKFYWQDWSDKRPPLAVLCPNGAEWCVDQRSSNGDGWKVIGDAPLVTCRPSIDVPGFHGWLRDGVFTLA